jgi:hypothetical protein
MEISIWVTKMTVPVMFMVLLPGCAKSAHEEQAREPQSIEDGGFFSSEPCGPPCFWNIVPGITTIDQAIDELEAHNVADLCAQYRNEEARTRGVTCWPGLELTISFQSDKDVVDGIGYSVSEPITVGDVIDFYGEPDAVFVEYTGLPHDYYNTVMMLYYDDIYTRLLLPEQESGVFNISSSIVIANIAYFGKDSYRRTRQRYHAIWNGYGQYAPDSS